MTSNYSRQDIKDCQKAPSDFYDNFKSLCNNNKLSIEDCNYALSYFKMLSSETMTNNFNVFKNIS